MQVIDQRRRDLGGFEVGRVLPYTRRHMVGPFIFFAAPAFADCDARADKTIPKGQWHLHWENDVLTRFASDEYFTNGLRVGSWDSGYGCRGRG